jgi:chemotaxis protein CheD
MIPVAAETIVSTPPRRRSSLLPGQWHTSESHDELSAVVSTGVVVCLWDGCMGGAGHFAMPRYGRQSALATDRYGDILLEKLLLAMLTKGANHSKLRATLAGGVCALRGFNVNGGDLGAKNVEFALDWLKTKSVQIDQQMTGGDQVRRITFLATTGEFSCTLLQLNSSADTVPHPHA